MRVITFKVEEDLLQKLDKYAMNHKLNRSEVVRLAIIEFLDNHARNKENDEVKVEKIKL